MLNLILTGPSSREGVVLAWGPAQGIGMRSILRLDLQGMGRGKLAAVKLEAFTHEEERFVEALMEAIFLWPQVWGVGRGRVMNGNPNTTPSTLDVIVTMTSLKEAMNGLSASLKEKLLPIITTDVPRRDARLFKALPPAHRGIYI